MKIFMENRHKIAKHNQKYAEKTVTFKLGVNKYADMLPHEFVNTLNGYNRTQSEWVDIIIDVNLDLFD